MGIPHKRSIAHLPLQIRQRKITGFRFS